MLIMKNIVIKQVKNYLIQHSPLPYSKQFKWQSPIQEKVRMAGYIIPSYCICQSMESGKRDRVWLI